MTQLIPFDKAAAEDLDLELSETMFRSTSDFITFYNSGLINKSAPEVSEVSTKIENTYKNVKLVNRNFVFVSKVEIELNETLFELKKWRLILDLKVKLEKLVEDNSVTESTEVFFDSEGTGILFKKDESYNTVEVSSERFYRPTDEELVREILTEHSSRDGALEFIVSDLLSLDESFITSVHQLVLGE